MQRRPTHAPAKPGRMLLLQACSLIISIQIVLLILLLAPGCSPEQPSEVVPHAQDTNRTRPTSTSHIGQIEQIAPVDTQRTDRSLPISPPARPKPEPEQSAATEQIAAAGQTNAVVLLEKVCRFYASAPALATTLRFRGELAESGQTNSFEQRYRLVLERPSRLYLGIEPDGREPESGLILACNGSNLICYLPSTREYLIDRAPKEIDGLPGPLASRLIASNPLFAYLDALLRKDPTKKLTQGGFEKTEIIHLTSQTSTTNLLLRFYEKNAIWSLLIEENELPWIRRIDVDLQPMLDALADELEAAGNTNAAVVRSMRRRFSIVFDNWTTSPATNATLFHFTPPEGARKISP